MDINKTFAILKNIYKMATYKWYSLMWLPSVLPLLLILLPRFLRPPSILLLALRKVMVAWLAVLKDILPLIADLLNCISLLLSRLSRGGGSLIASSSWSDLAAALLHPENVHWIAFYGFLKIKLSCKLFFWGVLWVHNFHFFTTPKS